MTSADLQPVPVMPPPRFFFGVSLTAAVFFGVWTWFVHPSEMPPPWFDTEFAQHWQAWSAAHRGVSDVMIFLTELGGVASMTLFTIMGVIWQAAVKQRTLVLAWIGVSIGGALINQGGKLILERPRPPLEMRDPAVHENNHSYPSGHSMGGAIGFGLLGYCLILPQRRRLFRSLTVGLMIVIVLGIGFSRVYLRAHWFSDVIAGWTAGAAWLFLCLGWLERRRLHETRIKPLSASAWPAR